jgi:hypothetical protein
MYGNLLPIAVNYSRRCVEASAVQAYLKRGLSLAPCMKIGYVKRDAVMWEVDTEEMPRNLMQCIMGSC